MTDIERQLAQEYAERQTQAKAQVAARIDEVTARDAEISRLQAKQRALFGAATRDMMVHKDQTEQITASLKQHIHAIAEQITARLEGLGLPGDYLEPHYECPICEDTGYLGEFSTTVCNCRKLRRAQLMREASGINAKAGQSFESFDRAAFPSDEQYQLNLKALALCEAYAAGLTSGGKLNLVLMGESGLGKTFLLNCVAERALENGVPALMMTAFNMLGAMREYHFGATGEGNLLSQMTSCELLLIDDLGTEPMLRNITVEYLFMLLNERMTKGLHTAVATNLSGEELQSRYGERVLSRMMDRRAGEFIRLRGNDLRFTRP